MSSHPIILLYIPQEIWNRVNVLDKLQNLHSEGTGVTLGKDFLKQGTAVLSEAWAKLRDWASVAGRGRLLLSGSVAHALSKPLYSLVGIPKEFYNYC